MKSTQSKDVLAKSIKINYGILLAPTGSFERFETSPHLSFCSFDFWKDRGLLFMWPVGIWAIECFVLLCVFSQMLSMVLVGRACPLWGVASINYTVLKSMWIELRE